jgi:hypothetical protein
VGLHGLHADGEDVGDLLVAVTLGDELNDPALARGQDTFDRSCAPASSWRR